MACKSTSGGIGGQSYWGGGRGGGVAPEALTSWMMVTGSYKEDVRRRKRRGEGRDGFNVVCFDSSGRGKVDIWIARHLLNLMVLR